MSIGIKLEKDKTNYRYYVALSIDKEDIKWYKDSVIRKTIDSWLQPSSIGLFLIKK